MPLAPGHIEAIAICASQAASGVRPRRRLAIIVDPKPIVATLNALLALNPSQRKSCQPSIHDNKFNTNITVDIFKSHTVNVAHTLTCEAHAQVLPISGDIILEVY